MSLENKTKDNITEPEQDITSSTEPTILKEDDDIQPPPKEVREAITQVVNNATVNATEPAPAATTDTELSGPVKMLKDAFPNLDLEIIETILQNHNGNVDGAFETLLGMSDPNYKPEQSSPDNNSDSNQHLDQMRQDEAFARQLVADEANRQQPAQTQNSENEPLFNFQEELPAIKEKAIEIGTAAKNKFMNFYNQLVSGDSMSAGNSATTNSNQSNTLESDLGNLNISDKQNIQRQHQQQQQPLQQQRSVDLYEWDGQPVADPPVQTSTSGDQLLADEEFARQLAREDAEAAAVASNSATVATTAPQSVQTEPAFSPSPPPVTTPAKNINIGPLKSGNLELAKDNNDSSNQDEVTFTAPDDNNQGKVKGFSIDNNEDDDLDDLFIRDDSNADSKPKKK